MLYGTSISIWLVQDFTVIFLVSVAQSDLSFWGLYKAKADVWILGLCTSADVKCSYSKLWNSKI